MLTAEKELYEPLWDEILARANQQGFSIRSIWIADVAFQGDSGVLNERLLGNDPGWHDHARDLLNLINIKRDQMPRPIVGIGHSFGGNNLWATTFDVAVGADYEQNILVVNASPTIYHIGSTRSRHPVTRQEF